MASYSSINLQTIGDSALTLGQKTSANSMPVVIASDQAAFPVSLNAGSNTIGSVKLTDGTNTQTFMSTTTTSKFGADVNILSILGTAPTTVGKLDVKGADGDVFVRQATASNLKATVNILGNAAATLDAVVGAGTAPTNMVAVGGIYNSTEISPSTGQSAAIQLDSKGRQRMVLMDAAGNTRGANVNSSNQLSVSVDNNPVLGAGTSDIGRTIQKDTIAAAVSFTISLNSLGNGSGRQSTLLTSQTARSALIKVKIKTGTSPTANTLISVYLIRGDGTDNDDSAGASDAAFTQVNAPLLGTILNNSSSTGQTFVEVFDTKSLGSLGATWGIAIVNSTGVALDASAGGSATYQLIT